MALKILYLEKITSVWSFQTTEFLSNVQQLLEEIGRVIYFLIQINQNFSVVQKRFSFVLVLKRHQKSDTGLSAVAKNPWNGNVSLKT